MISYEQALELIYTNVDKPSSVTTQLEKSLGFTLAEDIKSKEMIPTFDNSAMDGYAVICKDVEKASQSTAVTLKILGCVAAGDDRDKFKAQSGTAVEITTGAPVPQGYDGVIKVEDIIFDTDSPDRAKHIIVRKPIPVKNNIRDKGQDFLIDEHVCSVGDVVTPNTVMALSVLGVTKVQTYLKPHIGIVTTGKELVSSNQQVLQGGMIRDSNGPYLRSMLSSLEMDAKDFGSVPDNYDQFMEKLALIDQDENIDIMLTTGAVSKGRWDFIPKALKQSGAEIIFHRVNIKPGKPILFARLKNGTYFFGLPGNPTSVAVGFRFFVYPLIRALQGLSKEAPLIATLDKAFIKKNDRVDFLKSTASFAATGHLSVKILKGQESFKVSSMLLANMWALADNGAKEYHSGDCLKLYPSIPNTLFAQQKEIHYAPGKDSQSTAVRSIS